MYTVYQPLLARPQDDVASRSKPRDHQPETPREKYLKPAFWYLDHETTAHLETNTD
jgi:hypothetical protein